MVAPSNSQLGTRDVSVDLKKKTGKMNNRRETEDRHQQPQRSRYGPLSFGLAPLIAETLT
jgi:hypothetical protein